MTAFRIRFAIATLCGYHIVQVVLLLLFAAIMNFQRVRDQSEKKWKLPIIGREVHIGELSQRAYLNAMVYFVPGLLLDVLANVIWMSIILGELPKEWTVSARVERHVKHIRTDANYRFCKDLEQELLAPLDASGKHGKVQPG